MGSRSQVMSTLPCSGPLSRKALDDVEKEEVKHVGYNLKNRNRIMTLKIVKGK